MGTSLKQSTGTDKPKPRLIVLAGDLFFTLSSIALMAFLIWNNYAHKAYAPSKNTTQARIEKLSTSLDAFRFDTGRYPTTQEGLKALVNNQGFENWDGPYLERGRKVPNDPWDRPFHYQSPGTHGDFDLYSYGLDGTPGGEGENADVTSWE